MNAKKKVCLISVFGMMDEKRWSDWLACEEEADPDKNNGV
jgi:hypothetical protein